MQPLGKDFTVRNQHSAKTDVPRGAGTTCGNEDPGLRDGREAPDGAVRRFPRIPATVAEVASAFTPRGYRVNGQSRGLAHPVNADVPGENRAHEIRLMHGHGVYGEITRW